MQKLDALGRLLKCALELSQFEIRNKRRFTIKEQELVDFIVELQIVPVLKEESEE